MSEVENFRKSLMDKFEKLKDKAEDLRDILYLDGVLAVIQTHGKTADEVFVDLKYKTVFNLNWYMLPPKNSLYGEQKDWNQTLATTLNIATANLFKIRNELLIANVQSDITILVPDTFKKQFETLESYNKKTKVLNEKFKIEFLNEIDALYVKENDLLVKITLINEHYVG